jgi:ribosome-associated heat shock protein Hsp15
VRLAKTRSAAAAACRGGHVRINGKSAKPASPVSVDDRVEARLNSRDRVVIVTQVVKRRVGPVPAAECYDDHSPAPPERDPYQTKFAVRDPGAGRPTKRDRRRIDRLRGRSDR